MRPATRPRAAGKISMRASLTIVGIAVGALIVSGLAVLIPCLLGSK
jgi:hypothetical protein